MMKLNESQRIAVVQAKAAAAVIEALGMMAANFQAMTNNQRPPFEQRHFDAIGAKHRLGVNDIKLYLQGVTEA